MEHFAYSSSILNAQFNWVNLKCRVVFPKPLFRKIIWPFGHLNPLFSKLKVLNLDDTYKLSFLTFMHGYFNDNLPSFFQNMFKSLAEPRRTKSYKLEPVLNKNVESFLSAMVPKLWNAIEIDLKETKSAKTFKQRVININLENYEKFKCKKPSCISCE